MATPEIIANYLVEFCRQVVYPNGELMPSITGKEVFIRPGKPNPVALDKQLRNDQARVNIYPMPQEKNKSRFNFRQWETVSVDVPSLTFTVENNTITLTGTPVVDQTCLVVVNNDKANPFAYTILQDDTLNTIAANWAAVIADAEADNNIITIGDAYRIVTSMVTQGKAIRELKRQERVFEICVRTYTQINRDILANAIDNYLAHLPSFDITDDYSATMNYKGSPFNDDNQKTLLLDRKLMMSIEFATTEVRTFYKITDPYANVTRNL